MLVESNGSVAISLIYFTTKINGFIDRIDCFANKIYGFDDNLNAGTLGLCEIKIIFSQRKVQSFGV